MATEVSSKISATDLPFDEQVQHLRDKVRVPTNTWTDIWQGAHARAFVVAGATKEDLLCDFQSAILKAIEQGSTLQDFRQDFDQIVERHGWSYQGGRNWRSRVIFETNLRTSYQAGRFAQMKELAGERPFWRYRHGDSRKPRQEHLDWDGLVLRYDDPWWKTHYPPNGWGCTCTVVALTEREMKALGKEHADRAPKEEWQRAPPGLPVSRTPKGIDPGWAYNVGEAAHGQVKMLSKDELQGAKWEPIDVRSQSWETMGLPKQLPVDAPSAPLGQHVKDVDQLAENVGAVLGGEQRLFEIPFGPFKQRILVDARFVADHLNDHLERAPFVTQIPTLLEDPAEVWATFVRNSKTGQVALRLKILKRVSVPGKTDGIVMVGSAQRGQFSGWTFYPTKSFASSLRSGKLVYRRGS